MTASSKNRKKTQFAAKKIVCSSQLTVYSKKTRCRVEKQFTVAGLRFAGEAKVDTIPLPKQHKQRFLVYRQILPFFAVNCELSTVN